MSAKVKEIQTNPDLTTFLSKINQILQIFNYFPSIVEDLVLLRFCMNHLWFLKSFLYKQLISRLISRV